MSSAEATPRQFWESLSSPPLPAASQHLTQRARELLSKYFTHSMAAPFLSRDRIEANQLSRAAEILRVAARNVPVYADRLPPGMSSALATLTWERFHEIRPITKRELVAAFPDRCLNRSLDRESLYRTRSSGSTGEVLDIRIDEEALALDTIQGLRQLALQSRGRFGPEDAVAHIYTVPWILDAIDGKFPNHFISSLIAPDRIADILNALKPSAITGYPSVLEQMTGGLGARWDFVPRLIVTHSEQSTKAEREVLSRAFGTLVLDEYSSEEATRIALELPCGHYHTCDDAVIVEILDPDTLRPQEPGKLGLVAITNLLNTAMPFIRYIQGDMAIAGASADCDCNWGVLKSLEGRRGDSFVTASGGVVPSGTLLDITYRLMFDLGISFPRFELVQTAVDTIILRLDPAVKISREPLARHLKGLIEHAMSQRIVLLVEELSGTVPGCGKRRPIRREIAAPLDAKEKELTYA